MLATTSAPLATIAADLSLSLATIADTDPTLTIAWIAAAAAMLASLITGGATYLAVCRGDSPRRLRNRLRMALYDVAAFRELEQRYAEYIADDEGRTAESVRRQFRRELRDLGLDAPSERSSPVRLQQELDRLGPREAP